MAIPGLRIITDPDDPSVTHVYDSVTGVDISSSVLSGDIHIAERGGLITATLNVFVSEISLNNNKFSMWKNGEEVKLWD